MQTHLKLSYEDVRKINKLTKEVGIDNAEKRIEDFLII